MRDWERTSVTRSAKMSRRDFVGATAAVAAFTIVPRHVLGGRRHVPPSEKLNIAGIGVGGRGAGDLDAVASENMAALCDVDQRRAAATFKRYPRAAKYGDFRRMLDKEDRNIDAVIVATPDHVHAVATMAVIKRGKHVYCEKPLTEVVLLGNIALRTGQKLYEKGLKLNYDGPGMKVTNFPEANEYIRSEYRDGWKL